MGRKYVSRTKHLLFAAVAAVGTQGMFVTHASAAVVTQLFDTVLNSSPSGATSGSYSATFPVDLDNDGISDISFTHTSAPVITSTTPQLKVNVNGKLTLDKGATSQFVAIVKDTDGVPFDAGNPAGTNQIHNFAETLHSGGVVGPGSTLISLTDINYDNRLMDPANTNDDGAFGFGDGEANDPATGLNRGRAFIGFAFGDPGNPNYGYLALDEVSENGPPYGNTALATATLTGITYNTVPGQSVSLPITVTPEPAMLGGLMLASTALIRRRRS